MLKGAFLVGLKDYSTDQRGDVGSWVRLSSIAGLRKILLLSREEGGVGAWLPEAVFQEAIGAMWKQAAERIDHVRHTAGTSVLAVYRAYEDVEEGKVKPLGYDVVKATYGEECLRGFDQSFSPPKEGLSGETGAQAEAASRADRNFKDPSSPSRVYAVSFSSPLTASPFWKASFSLLAPNPIWVSESSVLP